MERDGRAFGGYTTRGKLSKRCFRGVGIVRKDREKVEVVEGFGGGCLGIFAIPLVMRIVRGRVLVNVLSGGGALLGGRKVDQLSP
jgi:hypothetical protein